MAQAVKVVATGRSVHLARSPLDGSMTLSRLSLTVSGVCARRSIANLLRIFLGWQVFPEMGCGYSTGWWTRLDTWPNRGLQYLTGSPSLKPAFIENHAILVPNVLTRLDKDLQNRGVLSTQHQGEGEIRRSTWWDFHVLDTEP